MLPQWDGVGCRYGPMDELLGYGHPFVTQYLAHTPKAVTYHEPTEM